MSHTVRAHFLRTLPAILLLAAVGCGRSVVNGPTRPVTTTAPLDKWAQHYYDRVAQFEKETVAPHGVVLVGSSHVEGFDAKLLAPRWRVINRGIASDRIGIGERGVLRRLDCSVFRCNPAAIVLENGVNDLGELRRNGTPSLDEIDACYREVVRQIRMRLPDVPLILVDLFPARDRYANLLPLIADFNARLQRIAADFDCPLVTAYPHLADADGQLRADYSRDGLHLSPAGYRVWAKLLDEALTANVGGTALDATQATHEPGSNLCWYDARDLRVEGKGWADTQKFYERLPAYAEAQVTPAVWSLSKDTAGIAVRFATNSGTLAANWDGGGAMNHMAATGNSGLDLYVKRDGRWVFRAVGRPQPQRTTATLASGLSRELTEYLLYLPLYADVTELRIGVESSAEILCLPPRPASRAQPLVFYGTSITQGGCAARAGMCHTAILGRRLDREVINLGFSGSGKMEPNMANLLSELDAVVYVLECLPNMTTEMVSERARPFVRTLRNARPTTPILLVENPLGGPDQPGNRALQAAYADLVAEGVGQLFYLPGAPQLAGDENRTVAGVPPTDLGFVRMADAYEPVLRTILTPQ